MLSIPDDLISEFIIEDDGKVFAKSGRAVSRLCGVTQATIQATFEQTKGDSLKPSKLAAILIALGFRGESPVPDIVIAVCLNYYALEAGRYCTDIAKKNLLAFSAIGIRTALQSALGYVPRKYRRNPTTLYSEILWIKEAIAEVDRKLDAHLEAPLPANLEAHLEASLNLPAVESEVPAYRIARWDFLKDIQRN
jgi:hypothetical protein